MSRITLSGNISGTGTFTVASPNSNTDRTLTLPDTAGTLAVVETGTYVPTVTASSGSITSFTATGTYTKIGRLVFATATVSITNNGTGAGVVNVSVPFQSSASNTAVGAGRENAAVGTMLQWYLGSNNSTGAVFTYNNQYPGGTNYVLNLNITYFV